MFDTNININKFCWNSVVSFNSWLIKPSSSIEMRWLKHDDFIIWSHKYYLQLFHFLKQLNAWNAGLVHHLFSVFCCRENKQKRTITMCTELTHIFCSIKVDKCFHVHPLFSYTLFCLTALMWWTCTYLERIFWITLFTQGASGSRQTSWPVFFRVALQHQARDRDAVRTS